ncbi:MAG: aminotransferase class I/II-fold pyridoxal phosphate-dependent enzyme [Chitinispirillaceae bacterium]
MPLNPQAAELNGAIRTHNHHVFSLLSEKGKNIFFPKRGILGQTAEAKKCKINATIGSAKEENGTTMCLDTLAEKVKLSAEDVFTYTSSYGKLVLREKWQDLIYHKNPGLHGREISLPVICSALTHGLSMGGYLFCDSGDKIIVPELFWENYRMVFEQAYNAHLQTFNTFTRAGRFDCEAMKRALLSGAPGKRILLLNFPNNPTGYTPTEHEVVSIKQAILETAQAGNQIVVFVDDAYFGLVYEQDVTRESIFVQLSDLDERVLAVKFDGATKEDYAWGFRIGFVTFGCKNGSEELYVALEHKLSGAVRGSISNASHLAQSLLLDTFTAPDYLNEKQRKFNVLKQRYDRIRQIMAGHPEYDSEFSSLPFNSGYFMCIKPHRIDAETLRQKLLADYSTGVIAQKGVIRIAFSSTPLHFLDELFDNIYQASKSL